MNMPIHDLLRHKMLLQQEYAFEKETFRRQTAAVGIRRKVKRGDAWLPVRVGRSYYNSLNQPVVEIMREAGDDGEHNFEYGRPVCFFTVADDGEKVSYMPFTATVSYADGDRMVLALGDMSQAAALATTLSLGVQPATTA